MIYMRLSVTFLTVNTIAHIFSYLDLAKKKLDIQTDCNFGIFNSVLHHIQTLSVHAKSYTFVQKLVGHNIIVFLAVCIITCLKFQVFG
jgi:hypothetical protein